MVGMGGETVELLTMPAVAVVVGCAAESVVLPVDNSQAQRCRGETCLECSGHETLGQIAAALI